MFNLSDKELDRLSREAADAYEVEKNTSSWEALENRLDQELGTAPRPNPAVPPPRRFISPIAYISLIILLISSGYFLLKSGKKSDITDKVNYTLNNSDSKNSAENNEGTNTSGSGITEQKKNEPDAATDANGTLNKQESATTDNTEEANAVSNASPKKEKTYLDNLKSIAEKELEKKDGKKLGKKETGKSTSLSFDEVSNESVASNQNKLINNENLKNNTDKKRKTDELKSAAANKTNESDISKHFISKGKEKNDLASIEDDKNSSIDNPINLKNSDNPNTEEDLKHAWLEGTVLAANHHKIIVSDSSLNTEVSRLHDEMINLNKKNKSLSINRSLQIGILFAPDFSKVKYVYENYHIGTSVGITLSYQLLHKFSINSGVLYANKFYQASGDDFHQQQQQLSAALVNEHVEFVRGSFKMIEMPLNLRYDFSADGNSIFFVNGGLSSYFILDQDNSYFCHDYVGSQRWIKENDGKNQSYWFSMLNLSLGFETFVQKNVSLQFDPYVKLPLKNIGVGNMRLNSYGINIGIKYSPILKRSRH